jgi:hypothetical protein
MVRDWRVARAWLVCEARDLRLQRRARRKRIVLSESRPEALCSAMLGMRGAL